MLLVISPKKITRFLVLITLVLSAIGIAAEFVRGAVQSWPHAGIYVLAEKFVLNSELSVPAWYSSILLLLCAALLGLVAWINHQTSAPFVRHWFGLCCIFVLLSIDELAAFHETLITPMQRYFAARGIFHYGWVIPASVFVVLVALSYCRFVFVHLDSRTRNRFILAGSIYVGAALGMEMLEGPIDEYWGVGALPGITAEFVEETFEMLGLVLFVHALLTYLETNCGEVRVRFESHPTGNSLRGGDCPSPSRDATENAPVWEEAMSELVVSARKREQAPFGHATTLQDTCLIRNGEDS